MTSRSDRWFKVLLRLYPADFRDEMGASLVEAYRDRARHAAERGGTLAVVRLWLRALVDSVRNGLGERVRPAVTWRRTGNWGRDAELAVRRLIRAPAFTISMVGTLTVGLGAFAVVYAVVDKILIEPLPYPRPNDLYFVWRDYTAWFDLARGWLAGPDVTALRDAHGPIQDAVGLRRDRRTIANSHGEGQPEEIGVMISSPNLFDVLGVRPLIGRGFAADEVGPNRPAVVVLSYDLWQRRFGGERSVIGQDVRIDGTPFEVIGVMPRDFRFVRHTSLGSPEGAEAYITFAYDLAARDAKNGAFAAVIRARPGSSSEAVSAAVSAVAKAIDERTFRKGLRLYAVGVKADLVADVRPALIVLGLSGLFLVLVLTVNLASLLLARAMQREREFAVSRALGANRMALVRATLLEAGMLGALGGAAATLVAVWGTRALVALAPLDLPRRESIAVDWRIALVVIGTGAVLGVLAGAAPALWASRSTLASLLRNAAVRGGGGQGRLRRSLVVVQVALCLVLLSTGGLVARSFEQLLRSRPGFDPAGVLTVRVPIVQARYPENKDAVAFHDRLQRELAAIPGVVSVGAAGAVPLTANTDQTTMTLPGAPGNTGVREHDGPLVDVISARAGWFRTLGIAVLSGRDFEPPRPGTPREVLIDRLVAEEFYPTGSPLGTRLVLGGDSMVVVGVVNHARQYDLHTDGRPQVYVRDEDDTYGTLYFALRTRRPPEDLVPDVRAVVRRIDPQVAISEVRTLDEVVEGSLRQQRVSAVLIGGFSAGALLLAAMGLFGVVAGSAARRRHEIAVRLALGADYGAVLRLVVGEGATLVLLGGLVGAPGVYVAGRLLRGALVGVSPFDPVTLGAVGVGLAAVALVACYLPARRVVAIDPARAFREG